MNDPAGATTNDLEIRIFTRQPGGPYPVEITLNGSQEFQGSLDGSMATWLSSGSQQTDGQALFNALFGQPALQKAWGEACAGAARRRLRLRIDRGASELDAIPWELLSEGPAMLAADAATPFSRYLPISLPWGRPTHDTVMRVLVAIANPPGLDKYGLEPVDYAREKGVLAASLGSLGPTVQVEYMPESGLTLQALEERLRAGAGFHVLHFVGHGRYARDRGQAALYLEGHDGLAEAVKDDTLVGMLARLPARPLLVFLMACQSADTTQASQGDPTGAAFRGLAPRLVEVGVPAVVAMQERVTVETAQLLESVFYRRLADKNGQVDAALNEARATLLTAGRGDAHVPVLLMRLKSGALWSDESDARGRILVDPDSSDEDFWPDLVDFVNDGVVVPVLGPRVHGQWLPTTRDVAERWSKRFNYPFPDSETDLARVAQYVQTTSQSYSMISKLYAETLIESYAAQLPEGVLPAAQRSRMRRMSLSELVRTTGWKDRLEGYPNDVHRVLASFKNIDLYLTTNPDPLLFEAISAPGLGRTPHRDMPVWKTDPGASSILGDYTPSPEEPLVYHLFGTDEKLESMVTTEDDYLSYISSMSENRYRIPREVWGMLAERSLLFIGYSLYDWEFRVLLHLLLETSDKMRPYRNFSVQLETSEARTDAEREKIQKFLRTYLRDSKITVYWGSTAQFIAELREKVEGAL